MTSQRSERSDAPPRLLRRRNSDRVLGGVAGGLGDYFNVDPLLIRISFVGLMIFGGAGLVLYVVAWLLLPAEGHDASPLGAFGRWLHLSPARMAWLAVGLVALFLLINSWNVGIGYSVSGDGPLGIPGVVWALAIVVTGVMLVRRREVVAAPSSGVAAPAAMELPARPVITAPSRPRSPLAWYISAAMLLAIGVLAMVSQVAERDVTPGQFFGAALVVLGIGLVVGAWWGRARILILLAILLAPLGVMGSFLTAPLEGGVGDHAFQPVTAAEVQDEYRSLGGRLTLDLTQLTTSPRDIHIAASVAVGQLMVILPEGASIELHTRVGAGDVIVLGSQDVGTSLDSRFVRRNLNQTTYILDLEAGIGEVYVRTVGSF
ncbi:MAG TPA: PspC domain-containing protein [Methylomirabilota bacterium]|nr:PspC domain-containing protein [Methylomirabilota bacterium]